MRLNLHWNKILPVLFFFVLPFNAFCLSEEELYQKVFGNKKPEHGVISTPVVFNGKEIGVVKTVLKKDQNHVQVTGLLENLKSVLKPEIYQKYEKILANLKWVQVDELKKYKLLLSYNQQVLAYELKTLAKFNQAQSHKIINNEPPRYVKLALRPSKFSFFQNFRSRLSSNSFSGETIYLLGDGAANLYDNVFEYEWEYYRDDGLDYFRRGEFRIVRDIPEWYLRSSLGDINYATYGRQLTRPLLGLSVKNDYNMDPLRYTYPIRSKEFVLDKTSTVKVWINGEVVHQIKLDPGPHRLEEFPLFDGTNEVYLEIEDEFGKKKKLKFLVNGEFEMLKEGDQSFSYALGIPRYFNNNSFHYKAGDEKLTYSFYHLYGLNNYMNVGGHLQGDARQQMLGGVFQTVGNKGKLSIEPNLSLISDVDPGLALDIYWSYIFYGTSNYFLRKVRLGLEKVGEYFGTLGNTSPRNVTDWSMTGAYIHRLNDTLSLAVSAKYTTVRDDTLFDSQTYTFGINKVFAHRWNVNLNLQQQSLIDGTSAFSAFTFLTFSLPEKNLFATLSNDTANKISRLDVRYSKGNLSDGVESYLGVQDNKTSQSAQLGARYEHYRFTSGVKHNYARSKTASVNSETHQTDLNFSTSLLYIPNKVTVSRPVENSFILVSKMKDLENKTILVNASNTGYESAMKFFNAAPLANVSSYNYRRVNITAPELSLENSLENEEFYTLSHYKTGHLIEVGKGETFYVKGRILDARGKPLTLKTGELKRVDQSAAPITFFTNRKGYFYIGGLVSGKYKLELNNVKMKPIEMNLNNPDGAGGVNLRPIRIK